MNDNEINKIKNILSQTIWHNNILSELDPYKAFNQLITTINQAIDLVAPEHVVTISAKKKAHWAVDNKGLIKSSKTKLNYYKEALLPNCPETDHERYKEYRNKYDILKDWHIYSNIIHIHIHKCYSQL